MVEFVLHSNVYSVDSDACSDVQVVHNALQTILRENLGNREVVIDCCDCGAAYRILMALLSVTPGSWCLTGTPRLLQRPMRELVEVLTAIGGAIAPSGEGWHIEGKPLRAAQLTMDCRRSSQFASALLLIAPKLGLQHLQITPEFFGSADYVQLTRVCAPWQVEVPPLPNALPPLGMIGDWSAALFWYAMAALHPQQKYLFPNLSLLSAQGDSIIAQWFHKLGVESIETPEGVCVSASPQMNIPSLTMDVAAHPDVVPVLSAVACLMPADFTFLHVGNLIYKESNRLSALMEQLAPFAEIMELEDGTLRIRGRAERPQKLCSFQTHHDHRLAMAFLLFGHPEALDDVACLAKSYPRLLEIT